MAHNHGNEYQIRIVREDGIEELSGWMNSTEQVAQAMLAVHRATRQNLLASGTKHSLSQLLQIENRFWNIPLWISRLHDASHTIPVICR